MCVIATTQASEIRKKQQGAYHELERACAINLHEGERIPFYQPL